MRYLSYLFIFMLSRGLNAADLVHPSTYIDKEACPGEWCTYGREWKVRRQTSLLQQPDSKSSVAGNCRVDSKITVLTGEVHAIAGKFVVKKAHGSFHAGDVIWVYTYLGEGVFKVWLNGRFSEEDLGFSPWGGTMGRRCESGEECWGTLERKLNFTWWIQVRNADGVIGWTYEADNFDKSDE